MPKIEKVFKRWNDPSSNQLVWSYDHKEKRRKLASVKGRFTSKWNRMVRLFFGGQKIESTPGHRFCIPEKGKYVRADRLMKGMKVLTLATGLLMLDSLSFTDTLYAAYNIEVELEHNYYVGEAGILVHNDCRLPKAEIDQEVFEAVWPPGTLNADEIEEVRKTLGDDMLPGDTLGEPSPLYDWIVGAASVEERVGRVRAWDKVKHSLDAGIAAKATDVPFLQKFDDIVQGNNLGLDENGLKAVLDAAAVKGQLWDFPENILDAVKRASDGNISGMVVAHKKFPTAANGNSGGFLVPAKQYQKAASGDANLSFEVGGRSFDDVALDGKLIDKKFGHSNSIFDRIENEFGEVELVVSNESRIISLLNQAKGQLNAAGGHPIRWEISTSIVADGIGQVFNGLGGYSNLPQFQGINFSAIEVVHVTL